MRKWEIFIHEKAKKIQIYVRVFFKFVFRIDVEVLEHSPIGQPYTAINLTLVIA